MQLHRTDHSLLASSVNGSCTFAHPSHQACMLQIDCWSQIVLTVNTAAHFPLQ